MKAAELEALEGPLQRHEISPDDHPLSLGSKSVWHQFFQVLSFSSVYNIWFILTFSSLLRINHCAWIA